MALLGIKPRLPSHTHACSRTHTHTHALNKSRRSHRSSETLGWTLFRHCCKSVLANPALVPCRWHVQCDGVGAQSPNWPLADMDSSLTLIPSYYQAPIDVTARWSVSLVDTKSPFNSWVNWSNVSSVSSTHTQCVCLSLLLMKGGMLHSVCVYHYC